MRMNLNNVSGNINNEKSTNLATSNEGTIFSSNIMDLFGLLFC